MKKCDVYCLQNNEDECFECRNIFVLQKFFDFDLMFIGSVVVFIIFIVVICLMFIVILIINNFVFLKKCFELMVKRCIVYISLIIDMMFIV